MDIVLQWNPALASGDWVIANGGILASQTGSDDLTSAVLVSLFTDQVAPPDFVPTDGTNDPRGWWADTYEAAPIGSLLWTLTRAKKTNSTALLRQAEQTCRQALQWLLDDGVAASVTAAASWLNSTALYLVISITKPAGETFNYAWAWQGF